MAKYREIPEGVPPEFVYLLTKAELYVKIGPDRYRKADAGKMPPQDWSPEELAAVQTGMEQICQFRGWGSGSALRESGRERVQCSTRDPALRTRTAAGPWGGRIGLCRRDVHETPGDRADGGAL